MTSSHLTLAIIGNGSRKNTNERFRYQKMSKPDGARGNKPDKSENRAPGTTAPCPSCLNVDWDEFPVTLSLGSDKLRELQVSLEALIKTKKKGCQPCFAIYRAIELLQGIDPTTDSLEKRADPNQYSVVYLILRGISVPLEVFAFIHYKTPPGPHLHVRVSLELYTEDG